MKLRLLKVAILENATAATLQADFNLLMSGQAVSASGTFAAGFITEQELVEVQMDGDRIMILYTEG